LDVGGLLLRPDPHLAKAFNRLALTEVHQLKQLAFATGPSA
jgi:hypothetical protein